MSPVCNDLLADELARDIAERGYAVTHCFLEHSVVTGLRDECGRLHREGRFRAAGIGTGEDAHVRDDIRGDSICWIEPSESAPVVQLALARFEALRTAVNREMLLGLLEFECHFACYAPGAGYQRHYDQFRNTTRRQLTVSLYLNEEWRDEYGGQLRLYLDEGESPQVLEITPTAGTMVVFLSERFAHEVMPCTRTRLSLTGWFLRRA